MDLGPMATKRYSAYPKAQALLKLRLSDCLVSYIRTLIGEGESYPSAEMQSVYSIAPADWAMLTLIFLLLTRNNNATTISCRYFTFYLQTFHHHYLFGLNRKLARKMECSNCRARCLSPTKKLIQTLEPFWSPDWHHPIKIMVSDWP